MQFTAYVVTGAGRGKKIGTPTLNVNLDDVPKKLKEGIYACRVQWKVGDGRWADAVLHYGPRPVFKDSLSCEVHILDEHIEHSPDMITIDIMKYLRPVLDFPSPQALKKQIEKDIEEARNIFME
ncbi:hypothetical protein A2635_02685 [Candidatus Peribacteria bacterium RIFCSPHIGHO2_01_FULL_51_9]|nr:MAG: hypothetical protein A2635_02685 [Candidatus Peribacteria bacterium RIFCSPHIGHO2_01_FULL_51_9]